MSAPFTTAVASPVAENEIVTVTLGSAVANGGAGTPRNDAPLSSEMKTVEPWNAESVVGPTACSTVPGGSDGRPIEWK